MTVKSPSHRRRLKRTMIFICISLVLLLGVAFGVWESGRSHQWWGETPLLRHLKTSPLATESLVGYKQIHQDQSRPVGYLGKRTSDWYSVWYDPGRVDALQAKRDIMAFAEQNGFIKQNEDPSSTYLIHAGDEYGEVSLFVRIADSSDIPKPSSELIGKVVVRLSYR